MNCSMKSIKSKKKNLVKRTRSLETKKEDSENLVRKKIMVPLGGLTLDLKERVGCILEKEEEQKGVYQNENGGTGTKDSMQPSVPPITATEAHEMECYLNLGENRTCKMFGQSIPQVDPIALK